MNKKVLLLLLIATISMTVSAATKYEINIAGVEVDSDNASYITGGDITSGYGVYNASSNTLTLYNMTIYRTGQDKYGIHNRKCDNLKIVFSGSCSIRTADNALKLERGTTLNAASGSSTLFYSSARICANLKSYSYYITGSGTMRFEANQSAYEAIKGDGTGSTSVYFQGAKVTAYSNQRSALSSFAAYLQSGTDLTIEGNGSNASVSSVSMSFSGNTTILEPYGAYYSNNSVYNSSGSQITSENIYISDNYALLINSDNFPNANFRSALLALYPKGYLTTSQLQNLTSLNVSGKSISSLTGVDKLTYLTTLNCSSNSLTSLPTLPTSLTTLNCSSNQLTSLPTLPTSLQSLNCSGNKFSGTFTLTHHYGLKSLDISNNPNLTELECFSNSLTSLNVSGCSAMTTLNCGSNQLTSLPTLPNSLKVLCCHSNQLTSLPNLPSGIQEVYAYENKFTTLSISGKSSLTLLSVENCPLLTTLECYNNALTSLTCYGCTVLKTLDCHSNQLTSLSTSGCSSLTTLNCASNQLTSLGTLPTSLQSLDCSGNKLSGTVSLTGRSNLKTLDISNNSSITTLNCYSNALTSLTVSGCSSLTTLNCSSNSLTSLGTLPTSLQSLNCSGNQLQSMPSLPAGLAHLDCTGNQLTYLLLPDNIETLYCGNNKFSDFNVSGKTKLKTLSVQNNANLTTLNCYTNALTSLDYSGCTALKTLDCANNKLTSLGSVPTSVTKFNCSANQLTALPSLPSGLQELECAANQLSSLTVHGLNSLSRLVIYNNQIKENYMGMLVNSLRTIPAGSTGTFLVLGGSGEGNEITTAQVNTARDKRWIPKKNENGSWVDIPGAVVVVPGDVNGDGVVTSADVTALYNYLLNSDDSAIVNGDQTGDGNITAADVTMVYNILLSN